MIVVTDRHQSEGLVSFYVQGRTDEMDAYITCVPRGE